MTQTLTLNLTPKTDLGPQTTDLCRLSDIVIVTTPAQSVGASDVLARIQQLRRWITSVYADATKPLVEAKRTLDQQRAGLLQPLEAAERKVMDAILTYQEETRAAQRVLVADALATETVAPPPSPTVITGMQSRTTVSAQVTDLRALVLSVAGQLLLAEPGATKVTRAWLTKTCQPSQQATLALLSVDAVALSALARALKQDFAVPGTSIRETTTLVSR